MKVDISKISGYKSDYLSFGFKEEDYVFTEIEIVENKILAKFDLTDCFVSHENEFHFTVPLAFRIISQLAIIFTCVERNYDKKPGEVYLRDIYLKSKKHIKKVSGLEIVLEIKKVIIKDDYFYYSGDINIENGAFWGEGSLIIPKMQNEGATKNQYESEFNNIKNS